MFRKVNILKKIVYIVGTRPEIIRSALIIKELSCDKEIQFKLVHTGQHYHYLMDKAFFEEFNLPKPDMNLKVGSGTHSEQTAKIMLELEKFLINFNPNVVIVFGDTNSSLAAALVTRKLQIPLVHIEAGCREWEIDMPEEINRRLIDHCSNILFAVSDVNVKNLKNENVLGEIYNTGDPLYEVFNKYFKKDLDINLLNNISVKKDKYFLLTLHRPINVDKKKNLLNIISAIITLKDFSIVFPIHPRTKKRFKELNFSKNKYSNLIFLEPLNYREILSLIISAKLVITDSGGLQKEAFWSGIPCVTLRDYTAWVETVRFKTNFLTGVDDNKIKKTIHFILDNYPTVKKTFLKVSNPYYKENTAENTIKLIKKFIDKYISIKDKKNA